jgi:hypothetical protein
MSEKSIFIKFLGEISRYFRNKYPFATKLPGPIDVALPKSSSFYLGVSPRFNKHVVINFMHLNKPWRIGQFTIVAHISSEYKSAEQWDVPREKFETFEDGLYNLAVVFLGVNKYWCLRPTSRESDEYTEYWKPTSYDNDESVIRECVADVCNLLENLFWKGGYLPMFVQPEGPKE